MGFEVYYKDKKTNTEHSLGVFASEEKADKTIKESVKLSVAWETEKRYSYHKRKV